MESIETIARAPDEWKRKIEIIQRRSELSICSWNSAECQITGLLLAMAGPATANARSPKLVFERGTWRWLCAAERSRERAVPLAFDRQNSLRYSGAVPWTAMSAVSYRSIFCYGQFFSVTRIRAVSIRSCSRHLAWRRRVCRMNASWRLMPIADHDR